MKYFVLLDNTAKKYKIIILLEIRNYFVLLKYSPAKLKIFTSSVISNVALELKKKNTEPMTYFLIAVSLQMLGFEAI
jgi:hypothetical protein